MFSIQKFKNEDLMYTVHGTHGNHRKTDRQKIDTEFHMAACGMLMLAKKKQVRNEPVPW